MVMIKKHISMNGDSRGTATKPKASPQVTPQADRGSAKIYKNLRIGQPVGTPSISKAKITAAVRAVMKEDGMI